MVNKKQIEVVIGGKVYRLSGSEGEEYIQSVARYLDNKLAELDNKTSSSIIYSASFPILFALNIADDLFKERSKNGGVVTPITDDNTQLVAQLNKKLVAQTKDLKDLQAQLDTKNNEAGTLNKQLEDKSGEGMNLAEQLKNATNDIAVLNKKLSDKNQELIDLAKKVSNKTIEVNDLNKKLADKDEFISGQNKKINDKNQELNNLSQKLADKNSALNELNKKSAERNQKLNASNKERDELSINLKSSNQKISALNEQISALKAKISELEETLKTEKAHFKNMMPKGSESDLMNALNALKIENKKLTNDMSVLELERDNAKNELLNFLKTFE